MAKFSRIILMAICLLAILPQTEGQVNGVVFGKNRLQFEKRKWYYYQTENFNVYYYADGKELAKFVLQIAEKELESIETAAEYRLTKRANIVLYNNYTDFQQTNIGLESDVLQTDGMAKFVNNKLAIYFDANHYNLKRQIRQGIAQVITNNILFGNDLGEIAGNQAFLDIPDWLVQGYISYLGENWSTDLDDAYKNEVLSGNYKNFQQLAFQQPRLAGHAFWYFVEERYKKENVTYFFYLMRSYKNLNKASNQITKQKFKPLLREVMEYSEDKYYNDLARRKAYPKGSYVEGFDINKRLNYYRFNVNPNKRNNSFVVTQYKKGIVRVLLNEEYEYKTLLKYGVRKLESEIHPHYPMMAWDPKGSRIAVIYSTEGRLKLFVYDVVNRFRPVKMDLTDMFDQIQDAKYMLDSKTLLLSAVKNGQTDIFTLDLDKEKIVQITNDIYDDLDPSFVAFPNKTGIIYASNRPSPEAKTGDSILPSETKFNIFLVNNFGDKPELNQITQLSDMKYGNARLPMQYNQNHFTFVSDANGIANRYAGFFTTRKEGLDTLVLIGEEILRNPEMTEVDSTLAAWGKTDIDSIAIVSISSDSAYTFPISNYPSNLSETRIAGDNNQVSEVTQQSDEKILYKLKIDEITLRNRNINARPTEYMQKLMRESKRTEVKPAISIPSVPVETEPADTSGNVFQSEFTPDRETVIQPGDIVPVEEKEDVLATAKHYRYKPLKFSTDFGGINFNNNILINRYQPYTGGSGPIKLTNTTPLSGLIRVGTKELMEDYYITGGFRLSTNLKDNEWMMSFQNLRKRLDWGVTYYRNVQNIGVQFTDGGGNPIGGVYPAKTFTNLYQANIKYPFDETRSLQLTTGIRADRTSVKSVDQISAAFEDINNHYSVSQFAFVYDNTLQPAMNIWNGLRYKVFFDWYYQINKGQTANKPQTFNAGFDVRYYYPIHNNFIWAGRAAGDFSFGNQKMIYYLGGMDGWMMFGNNQRFDANGNLIKERYFNSSNTPDPDQTYAFQSLAVNMRGYIQNVANGNNAVVINSEFRLPIISTFFEKPVSNSFLKNLQIIQFFDFGTAWNGAYDGIKRPEIIYGEEPVLVRKKAGGLGPFAGGYGFGIRSTVLDYFLKFDAGWPMDGVFKGKPILYLSMGVDF